MAVGRNIDLSGWFRVTLSSKRDFTLAVMIQGQKFIKETQMQMDRANFGRIGSRLTELAGRYVKFFVDAVICFSV